MKQKISHIKFIDFAGEPNPYGTIRGKQAHDKLVSFIESTNTPIFGISFKEIEGADSSYLRESLISVVKKFKDERTIFIEDLTDPDIIYNLKLAANAKNQPIVNWVGSECEVLGPQPSSSNQALLDLVISNRSLTTSKASSVLDISVQNASTKLKKLFEDGYVSRTEEAAETGGKEFVYHVIGKSA
ncbi:hypothetical protein PSH28_22575 [Pseudomonas resinovorans]|uniref:hypothetical protein n=1 Tax=Metapseudomonas resinovorans TaxID=53412 RepID=UPI00237F2E13|nr:hypothetical protein [Pseudomonas resinovorans]MDE3739399.1 hypothetical protein [Pseudomonas resinovorans]